jgi:predicted nucleic acid-binding Zn ribbon protein
MARAPRSQRRRFGRGELMQAAEPAAAEPLLGCLESLLRDWRSQGSIAAIWQDWPRLAGSQLAPHCHPLSFHGGLLTVGASQPQWRQALQYSRPQLLAALRSLATCPQCQSPAPAGEMALWGHCGFCRRQLLASSDTASINSAPAEARANRS